MKFNKTAIPPDEAHFIETKKFSVEDVARIYRVPPHKIGHLERATFSNIEHQSIEYVRDTLRPWLVRWEQAILIKLLGVGGSFFAEHVVDGLLRGDTGSRYTAYHQSLQDGWRNRDEVRELENLNPLPDGVGQVYLEPLNMTPAGSRKSVLEVDGKKFALVEVR